MIDYNTILSGLRWTLLGLSIFITAACSEPVDQPVATNDTAVVDVEPAPEPEMSEEEREAKEARIAAELETLRQYEGWRRLLRVTFEHGRGNSLGMIRMSLNDVLAHHEMRRRHDANFRPNPQLVTDIKALLEYMKTEEGREWVISEAPNPDALR